MKIDAHSHYLDHAATSPLLPEAYEAMLSAMQLSLKGELGNASSLHHAGHHSHEIIEEARAEIAHLINAEPSEIIFTSGGTESNNTVMHIFEGQDILVSNIEHPSLLESAKKYGKSVTERNVKDILEAASAAECSFGGHKLGRTASSVPTKERLRRTGLCSIMLANNELGTIFDIKSLAKDAHSHASYFHTDATQALGKIPIDVKDLDVDYLTASAHKIGGPVGIGILYVKNGAPYKPLLVGGHQENNRRAGTSQVVNIAGFGAAAKYARTHKTWKIYDQKIRPFRDKLAKEIMSKIQGASLNTSTFGDIADLGASKCIFQTTPKGSSCKDGSLGGPAYDISKDQVISESTCTQTLPNILNVSFQAAEGESIQLYLDLEANTQVSTGSACATGHPSHVLMAISGGDAELAHSSIRFSLGLDTTEEDIDQVMRHLPKIVHRLQGISTLKVKEQNA